VFEQAGSLPGVYATPPRSEQLLFAWTVRLERSGIVIARLLARAPAFEATGDES